MEVPLPQFQEDVKHFSKALFSTFLGLLMALGLESWHLDYRQRRAARAALESVLQEMESNRKALHDLATINADLPRNLTTMIGLLESLQDDRRQHRPWRLPDVTMNLTIHHTGGRLKSSAWEMALANQSVQRFPKAQAGDLADFYQQMGRLQALLDQSVDYAPYEALSDRSATDPLLKRLEHFSDGELEHILWSLRQLKVRFELIGMWSEGIEKDLEKKGFRGAQG